MKDKMKNNLPIAFIMLIGFLLYIINIGQSGYANQYYAAGVYSMGQNLHAFFFNSFDSIGFVTIDKPPLGFWIQVLFIKIFGFHGWALILPEILCGVASIYVIYHIIYNRFGKGAGLVSAAVLAITPIFVAVTRNNTIDGILILLMVLAANQAIIATEKGSLKHLVFAGIFLGLGFNVKMLQAYMIVPAVYLTYLIFSQKSFFKRIFHCFVSCTILLVLSMSWIVAVDMVDPENRPYVGSSDNNSAVELAIGYNGINRIFGRNSPIINQNQYTDNNPLADNNIQKTAPQLNPAQNQNTNPNIRPNQNNNQLPPNQTNQQGNIQVPIQPNNTLQKQKSGGEAGKASLFRLYNVQNAGQISWFVIPAIICSLLVIYLISKGEFSSEPKNIAMLFFAIAFISMFIYFSFAGGLAHRYYFATMAPYITGLTGILYYFVMDKQKYILPIIFAISAVAQIYIQSIYGTWLIWLLFACLGLFIVIFIIMIAGINAKWKNKYFTIMLSSLLILPAIWSATPIIYGENTALPIAGPELITENKTYKENENDFDTLVDFLEKNRDGADYLAVTLSSNNGGAALILASGEPVAALGGFNGADNILSIDEITQMIDNNDVKYAYISNTKNNNKNAANNINSIQNWIEKNCKKVPPRLWSSTANNNAVLYDLSTY